jgi:hypothetical protein
MTCAVNTGPSTLADVAATAAVSGIIGYRNADATAKSLTNGTAAITRAAGRSPRADMAAIATVGGIAARINTVTVAEMEPLGAGLDATAIHASSAIGTALVASAAVVGIRAEIYADLVLAFAALHIWLMARSGIRFFHA